MSHSPTFAITPTAPQDDARRRTASKARSRRQQVSKACVWCREYRIRCDATVPCRNCEMKGRKCTSERGQKEVRTFAAALREIDRLNTYVKELEEQVRKLQPNKTGDGRNDAEATNSQPHDDQSIKSHRVPAVPTHLDPLAEFGFNKKYYNWDVVSTRRSKTHQQTYGTSSSFYYINQMSVYMETVLREKRKSARFDNINARRDFGADRDIHDSIYDSTLLTLPTDGCDLSRATEESFLRDFWSSFYLGAFTINCDEFQLYYNELWQSFRAVRSSSALVDVMIALCMQSHAQLSWRNAETLSLQNPDVAGRWWHRRGQQLLDDDLEEPSIATFQCHLLSVMWLSNAGLHNTAHCVMASGIRIGIILGLHLEPPRSLAPEQREFRKRLWWTTYALEMKFAMELGRPLAVNCTQVACSLPSGKSIISGGERSGLSFNVHLIKLLLASRAVYITFYQQCAKELEKNAKDSIYDDLTVLEECAKFLSSKVVYLQTWAKHVPSVLHARRKTGKTFSVDDLDLDIGGQTVADPTTRQAILLELHYHAMAMNLFRPFIVFSPRSANKLPQIETHALSCVRHATAITSILKQTCAESSCLDGMPEVWQWQWSAALSLVGYILAYPGHSFTPSVRYSVDGAISVLNSRSKHDAAKMIQKLVSKADSLNSIAGHPGESGGSDRVSGPIHTRFPEAPVSCDLDWNFGFDFNNLSGGLNRFTGDNGVVHGTGQSFTLQGFEAGDQSMFDLFNFESMEGFEP